MERKKDEWSKSQNISLEQTYRTDPPPPQAHTEHVNVVFTGSGKFDDHPKIQKDPPPSIIINNKIKKDRPIKTSKDVYVWSLTPFLEYDTGSKLSEFGQYFVALRIVLVTLLRLQHSLLVLKSPKYPKNKKNMLDEEEVLCQP
ncbi:hypothetical protein Tco_0733607 [Tanacetum coccineum]